jgi:hypothetical protein
MMELMKQPGMSTRKVAAAYNIGKDTLRHHLMNPDTPVAAMGRPPAQLKLAEAARDAHLLGYPRTRPKRTKIKAYPTPFTRNQGGRGFEPDIVRCIGTTKCRSSLSRDSVRDPDVMLLHFSTGRTLPLSRAFASGGSAPAYFSRADRAKPHDIVCAMYNEEIHYPRFCTSPIPSLCYCVRSSVTELPSYRYGCRTGGLNATNQGQRGQPAWEP